MDVNTKKKPSNIGPTILCYSHVHVVVKAIRTKHNIGENQQKN